MTPLAPEDSGKGAAIARLVADHWRAWAMSNTGKEEWPLRLMAHPLRCVLAALDGETDPEQLGIEPDSSTAAAIRSFGRPEGVER